MRIRNKKSSRSALSIVLPIVIALALIGAATAYAYSQKIGPFSNNDGSSNKHEPDTTRDTNSVDYSGPTDEDLSSSQDAKNRGLDDGDKETPSTSKKTANLGLSYADINGDSFEVRAFVNNIVEGTGTCTATLTKESTVITASSKAFVDTSSSICTPIYIDKNRLVSGKWSLKVTYNSPSASGSVEEGVDIP